MACGQLPVGGCWLPLDHTGRCVNPDTAKRVLDIAADAVEMYRTALPLEGSPDQILNHAGAPRSRDDMSWAFAQARDIVTSLSVYLPRKEEA